MRRILFVMVVFSGLFVPRAFAAPIEWQWTGTGTTTALLGGPTSGTVTFTLAFDSDAKNGVPGLSGLDPDQYGIYATGSWVLDFFDGTSDRIWSGSDYLGVNLDIGDDLVPADNWFVVRGFPQGGPYPQKLWLAFDFPNPNSSLLPTSPPLSAFGWISLYNQLDNPTLINVSLDDPQVVPEPPSVLLLASGLALGMWRLRSRLHRDDLDAA